MKPFHLQVITGVVFVALLAVVLSRAYPQSGKPEFADDAAWLNLAVARTVAESGNHGLAADQPIAATRHGLWRLLLAAGSYTGMPLERWTVLLGGVLALLLVAAITWGVASYLGLPTAWLGALLAALAGGLSTAVAEGQPAALAALLVTAALVLYVRGAGRGESPLPVGSAVLLGLAATLQIELTLLWGLLVLHALLLGAFDRTQEAAPVHRLLKGLTGVLAILCCLAPQIAWNMFTIGVPWPRAVDASLTLDALQQGQRVGLDIDRAMVLLRTSAPFDQKLFTAVLALSCLLLLVDLLRRRAPPSASVFLMLLALPLPYAVLAPVTGWGGGPLVFASLAPVWCLLAAYGVARVAEVAVGLGGRLLGERLQELLKQFLPGVLAVPLLMTGVTHELSAAREHQARAQVRAEQAKVWSQQVPVDPPPRVLTDVPGRLAYQQRCATIDLRGEATPAMLAFVTHGGSLDRDRVVEYLRSKKPSWCLFAEPVAEAVRRELPCGQILEMPRGHACALNWETSPPRAGT